MDEREDSVRDAIRRTAQVKLPIYENGTLTSLQVGDRVHIRLTHDDGSRNVTELGASKIILDRQGRPRIVKIEAYGRDGASMAIEHDFIQLKNGAEIMIGRTFVKPGKRRTDMTEKDEVYVTEERELDEDEFVLDCSRVPHGKSDRITPSAIIYIPRLPTSRINSTWNFNLSAENSNQAIRPIIELDCDHLRYFRQKFEPNSLKGLYKLKINPPSNILYVCEDRLVLPNPLINNQTGELVVIPEYPLAGYDEADLLSQVNAFYSIHVDPYVGLMRKTWPEFKNYL
jgi:hypothetical protein